MIICFDFLHHRWECTEVEVKLSVIKFNNWKKIIEWQISFFLFKHKNKLIIRYIMLQFSVLLSVKKIEKIYAVLAVMWSATREA